MKYPECCYRIGNEFISCGEKVKSCGKSVFRVFQINTLQNKETDSVLTGITAETLAELARENEETMVWDDGMEEVQIKFNPMTTQTHRKGDSDSLGEFFLRVAKERNYIK